MTTETLPTAKQELDQAIARFLTGARDAEAGRKAREDMDRMREETRKRIGTVEVAVDLVRDARDQRSTFSMHPWLRLRLLVRLFGGTRRMRTGDR